MTRERALELAWDDVVMGEHQTFGDWQNLIAEAILAAVAEERESCAKILEESATKLIGGKRKVNQVDAHNAWVLKDHADQFRERGIPLKVGA